MTFDENTNKSVAQAIVIAELDIGKLNISWINIGAGIWCFNTDGIYSWVDSTLLTGLTAVYNYANIGSVYIDGLFMTQVYTLPEVTTIDNCFYWDRTGNTLYIKIHGYDDPWIHNVIVGVTYGYSYSDISPSGSLQVYDERLTGDYSVESSRDPSFFGKIAYTTGGITLLNGDGEFDTFTQDNDVYGNEVRTIFGYSNLPFSEYKILARSMVENVSLNETEFTLSLADKRKALSKKILYYKGYNNALDTIADILYTAYGYTYNEIYFDLASWEYARMYAPSITIDHDDTSADDTDPSMTVIDMICLLYTSPSPRDRQKSRMPSSA